MVDKIKTFDFKEDKYEVTTVINNGRREEVFTGQPLIAVYNEFIQVGCIRFTKKAFYKLAVAVGDGLIGVVQEGNYTTKDPNTR